MKQSRLDRAHGAREGEVDQKSRARGSAPTCPKCGGTKYRNLASSDTVSRYECSNFDCMESFSISTSTPALVALGAANSLKKAKEAADMATVKKDLKCSLCDKAFAHEGWLEKHAANCTGGGAPVQRKERKPRDNDGSVEEDPDLPGAQPKRKAVSEVGFAAEGANTLMAPARTMFIGTALGAGPKAAVLAQLREQQKSIEGQLAELKLLIKGIAEIEITRKETA